MFESVDVGNGTASVVVNPYFRSTWDGYRPRIERIYWRLVPLPLMVDALAAGEAHIADNVGDGMMIENALSVLVGAGTHSFVTYDGTTQLFAQFHVDTGPTQFRAVRQAMSYMVDRHRVAEEVTRGFGVVVHGPWATPWWWYQAAADLDLYDRIKIYGLNIAEAIRLLEEDGWVYDAQGNPYVGDALSDSNNIRHKWVDEWVWGDADGNPAESVTDIVRLVLGADNEWSHSNKVYTGERVLMPLIINWMVRAIDYPFRDSLEVQLYDNMAAAGGRLIQERSANWGTYLQTGYRQEDRFEFHTLGIIPAIAWSPWFNAALDAIPSQNWHQADDPEYRRLANNVRAQDITTPEGRDAFVEAFTQYMVFRTYEAYTLPFSVSLTHDFFPVGLGGWFNNSFWRPEQAVQRAYWR
jgi:peptide/nickel transport system substrate-binding protein